MDKMLLRLPKRFVFLVSLATLALVISLSGSAIADNIGPVFSGQYPAPGSSVNSSHVTVYVNVNDQDNVNATSVIMKVDGVRISPVLQYGWIDEWTDDYTTLDINYSSIFSNGSHTVEVSASDGAGNISTTSWSFTVGETPKIGSLAPAGGSVITERKPVISAVISAAGSINPQSITMTVDGAKVPASFDPISGKVAYIPVEDMANEAGHAVSLQAADYSGNLLQVQWQFIINTYTDMTFPVEDTSCQKCHRRADHPMNNCGKCHGINHDNANPEYPIDDCYKCHNNTDNYPAAYHMGGLPNVVWPDHPVRVTDSCVACHNAAWKSGIPSYHSVSNTAERHLTTSAGCQECHAKSLTREHQRRTDAEGNAMTCYSCHNSPDSRVRDAIRTKNSACTACHNLGPDGGHPAHSGGLDANCQTCHSGSILTEPIYHQKNGCNNCHSEAAPDIVKYSVSINNTNCFSCHKQGHNVNFVQMVPSDIPLFPGYKWTLPQDAAIWSGEQWFDGAYNNVGAKIIISNRLQSAGSAEVQAWYEQKMNGNGWVKEQDSAQSEGNFKAVYAKGNRMATIIFYGGETPDRPSPFVGYRLMILYK